MKDLAREKMFKDVGMGHCITYNLLFVIICYNLLYLLFYLFVTDDKHAYYYTLDILTFIFISLPELTWFNNF